ncbi:hypothetical protein [Acetobacterium wieringae]|uniref:hypothetical protein n=1 Tax=Acetobacterium wieringae TaxID=52694 RepID=UPI0020345491|nr:hypothetical protein [Acetobacterium wieringae]URN85886.1 hypothetical protein CHL1_001562 [Acetobacterium wieringae]
MENRFGTFGDNDSAKGLLFNQRISEIGNELIEEHNNHIADTDIHVTAEKQEAWDALKTFQTAGGTATVITLTGVELVDGFQTTFVIASSNSGAATTINAKPLYKPGTTTAPKLVAGKAATVWYNAIGDCFFIKASAEGTATAGDVLAGQTFSNDDDIGLIGTLALTGDAVAADVVAGKMFYSDDAKNKLTGTNPYKSGMKISYDNLIPEMPLVPYKDLIPQWITSLESMYFDKYSNKLMIEVITSGERRIYVFDSDGNWLNNFIISPASSVYRVILYENNYFIFYNGGWAKHNPTGTLITSGTDFSLRTGDTDLRVERVSEHQIKAFQADGSVKRFNMATMTVDQTISLPNLYSGTIPFFDDAGNWYYHAASALITKFNANGDVVFSGAAHNFENLSTPTYKVFDVGAKVIASRVYNGYFRTKIVSTSDWSLINSQVSQVSTDTGLQCGYPNLASSKKLLFLKSTSTYYLYAIKLDDQAQGIQSTFGQILSTSNMVNGLYANSDDEVFTSYLISGYPAVKKLKFNYQLS